MTHFIDTDAGAKFIATGASPIAAILGIEPTYRAFAFDGRSFEYHPGSAKYMTTETIYTYWADASRSVASTTTGLDQAIAVLLSHRFRHGVSAAARTDILARARAELALQTNGAVP